MHRFGSMKVGTVQLWLLLLLSDKPMYGYEIIRELERRFSGYWQPKTGTIYPALEKLEENGLITGQIEFRDHGPDRKHYAITIKGEAELKSAMIQWSKMTEMITTYRESHQALFRFKKQCTVEETAEILVELGKSFKTRNFELSQIFASEDKSHIEPTEPTFVKLLYAKENHKYEIHLELEWIPRSGRKPNIAE